MKEGLKPIVEMFSINNSLFDLSFQKVNDEQSRKQFEANTNNLVWLLAHLTTTRYFIGGMIGIEREAPWDGLFNKAIKEIEASKFPALADIKEAWSKISEPLMSRFPELTDQDLAGEPPIQFPTSEQTILAAIAFLAQHESYHLGQVAYIRRLMSEDGLYKILFDVG